MSTEVCSCGAPVQLIDNTLRLGARTVGCRRCNWTGKREYRETRETLIQTITNNRTKGAK